MSKIFINNGEYETADPVLTGRDFAALSNTVSYTHLTLPTICSV